MSTATDPFDTIGSSTLTSAIAISRDGSLLARETKFPDVAGDRWGTRLELLTPRGDILWSRPDASQPAFSPDGLKLAYFAYSDSTGTTAAVLHLDTLEVVELQGRWAATSTSVWDRASESLYFSGARTDIDPPADDGPWVITRTPYKVDGIGRLPAAPRNTWRLPLAGTATVFSEYTLSALSFSPDGKRIAAAGRSATTGRPGLAVFDCTTAAQIGSVEIAGGVSWTQWHRGHIVLVGQPVAGPCHLSGLAVADLDNNEVRWLTTAMDRRVLASSVGGSSGPVYRDGTVAFSVREHGAVHAWTVDIATGHLDRWIDGSDVVVPAMAAGDSGPVLVVVATSTSVDGLYTAASLGAPLEPISVAVSTSEGELHDLAVATDDGTVHGYVWRPRGAEGPTPLLVDIHGGPDTAWRPSLSPYYLYREDLLRAGWSILLLNPRGSDGHGLRYMRHPIGRLGHSEEHDFTAAIEQLIADGQADPSRLAVMGSSHGGFLTNWLTARTKLFAAAVSIGCIANWLSLYGTSSTAAEFVEHQMGGAPSTLQERYLDSSPITYVSGVHTPTLIIHGEEDHLNPVGQAEEWFTGLLRSGHTRPQLVRYEGASHLFMYKSRLSVQHDFRSRVVDWLRDHIQDRAQPSLHGGDPDDRGPHDQASTGRY